MIAIGDINFIRHSVDEQAHRMGKLAWRRAFDAELKLVFPFLVENLQPLLNCITCCKICNRYLKVSQTKMWRVTGCIVTSMG